MDTMRRGARRPSQQQCRVCPPSRYTVAMQTLEAQQTTPRRPARGAPGARARATLGRAASQHRPGAPEKAERGLRVLSTPALLRVARVLKLRELAQLLAPYVRDVDAASSSRPAARRRNRCQQRDSLRWTRRGEVPAIRSPSGALRYSRDALDAWLAAHVIGPEECDGPAAHGPIAKRERLAWRKLHAQPPLREGVA